MQLVEEAMLEDLQMQFSSTKGTTVCVVMQQSVR